VPIPQLHPDLLQCLQGSRLCVVDVGARSGLHPRWMPYGEVLSGVGFEADVEECQRLNEGVATKSPYPIRFLPNALGNRDGEITSLNICRQPGCSSIFEPNTEFVSQFAYGHNLQVVRKVPVSLSRLDTVCESAGIEPDVLKIDTQGFELSVLEGCGGLLQGMLMVELEVEFAEQYRGQPLFRDIDGFLSARGFTLMGLRRSYWRREIAAGWPRSAEGGTLMHGDALYVNRAVIGTGGALDDTVAAKALVALAAYRQHDTIAWLLATPHPSFEALSQRARKAIARSLMPPRSAARRLVSGLIGSRPSNTSLRRLVDGMRTASATDWHDPTFF
jgi:FkbM family methyltransferase